MKLIIIIQLSFSIGIIGTALLFAEHSNAFARLQWYDRTVQELPEGEYKYQECLYWYSFTGKTTANLNKIVCLPAIRDY